MGKNNNKSNQNLFESYSCLQWARNGLNVLPSDNLSSFNLWQQVLVELQKEDEILKSGSKTVQTYCVCHFFSMSLLPYMDV